MMTSSMLKLMNAWKVFLWILLAGLEKYNADYNNYDLAGINILGMNPTGFFITGASSWDQSGVSVSSAGDVNRDGVDDFLVGAFAADPVFRLNAGITYVIFGRSVSTGPSSYGFINLTSFANSGTTEGFAIIGAVPGDYSGYSVSAAGDVNNDGIDDIVIGAFLASPIVSSNTRTGAGCAYVVFGRSYLQGAASYVNIDLAFILAGNSPLGFAILGAVAGDNSGRSVCSAGDVNGDGIADVIVDAYLASPNVGFVSRTNAGMAYVIFGRDANTGPASYTTIDLLDLATAGTVQGFAIIGAAPKDNCGTSVSGAGDINDDGVDDVIVGAYLADVNVNSVLRTAAGKAYVIYGRSIIHQVPADTYFNIDLATLVITQGFTILGAAAGDQTGYFVRNAQDVNSDGVDDVIVGAPLADPVVGGVARPNAGISYVIFGASGSVDVDLATIATAGTSQGFAILGAAPFNENGWSVSGVGDFNGDSVPDMIMGAWAATPVVAGNTRATAGASYLVYGRPTLNGLSPNIDLASFNQGSSLGFRIMGAFGNDQSGFSVSGAGDVNQDGLADVIVGAYMSSISESSSGTSYVIFGAQSSPTSQPSSQPSGRPSRQPNSRPSGQPTSRPSAQPSSQPQSCPTSQPTGQPSCRPISNPSSQPSSQPSAQPQRCPSSQPSAQPQSRPSSKPSSRPSVQPSSQPIARPSAQPSGQPSRRPSAQPSRSPSDRPTSQPSSQPSAQPQSRPSSQPSVQPSARPSMQPTARPSGQPSGQPSTQPSVAPSVRPSARPTVQPSEQPSTRPSAQPSIQPSAEPSVLPSAQPSCLPSTQPTARPSSVPSSRPSCQPGSCPSGQPSSTPSMQPSADPSAVPSTTPSSVPSSYPTTVPSSQPSVHPSTKHSLAPSAQPTGRPSRQPSAQPMGQPTSKPSAQPSSVPSSQPSRQPRAAPSGQPTAAPSARPTLAPTGEWATVLNVTSLLTKVAYPHEYVWACGGSGATHVTMCVLAAPTTGDVVGQFSLGWDSVTSVLSMNTMGGVVISGRSTSATAGMTSQVATCRTTQTLNLHCSAMSFSQTEFLAGSYVPLPKSLVFIGWYYAYTSISIVDAKTGAVKSYMYTASNVISFTLAQIQSPPAFVGTFVAGTAIRATATPVNYIVAGMVRTDGGNLRAISLIPLNGNILNNADLVNAMALEYTGPDSFIAGGLLLADVAGLCAYLLRANALYNTVSYCVRYRSQPNGRRALSSTGAAAVSQSVVRGMVLMGTTLFMIADHTVNNITSLTVLKTSAVDGAILKQVHVIAPNATSLYCTDITVMDQYLSVVCTIRVGIHSPRQSLLLAVDQKLSFAVLPEGFVRNNISLFSAETVPFKSAALIITQLNAIIPTTNYNFTSVEQSPTRQPSPAPSYAPSSQPSSASSSQPSSSPTAAPSVSARPTSQPSTSGPTITHRPTVEPTVARTRTPSVAPTARHSVHPTINPSARPTVQPSPQPTLHPTAKPSPVPTGVPKQRPSARPTTTPIRTAAPSRTATPIGISSSGDNRKLPSYVVGASVGGGLGLLLIGFVLFRYYQHDQEEKLKDKRRIEYFQQQALLAEQERVYQAQYRQEMDARVSTGEQRKEKNPVKGNRRGTTLRSEVSDSSGGGDGDDGDDEDEHSGSRNDGSGSDSGDEWDNNHDNNSNSSDDNHSSEHSDHNGDESDSEEENRGSRDSTSSSDASHNHTKGARAFDRGRGAYAFGPALTPSAPQSPPMHAHSPTHSRSSSHQRLPSRPRLPSSLGSSDYNISSESSVE